MVLVYGCGMVVGCAWGCVMVLVLNCGCEMVVGCA